MLQNAVLSGFTFLAPYLAINALKQTCNIYGIFHISKKIGLDTSCSLSPMVINLRGTSNAYPKHIFHVDKKYINKHDRTLFEKKAPPLELLGFFSAILPYLLSDC